MSIDNTREEKNRVSDADLTDFLRIASRDQLDKFDFSKLEKSQIEKVFRWSIAYQIQTINSSVEDIQNQLKGTEETVSNLKKNDFDAQIKEIQREIKTIREATQTQQAPTTSLIKAVEDLKSKLTELRESLIKVNLNKLADKVDQLSQWCHKREVMLSDEVVYEMKTSIKENNAFQLKVLTAFATASSIFSLLMTLYMMYKK